MVSLSAIHDGDLRGDDRSDDVFSVARGGKAFIVVDGEVEGGEDAEDELARGAVDVLMDGRVDGALGQSGDYVVGSIAIIADY